MEAFGIVIQLEGGEREAGQASIKPVPSWR